MRHVRHGRVLWEEKEYVHWMAKEIMHQLCFVDMIINGRAVQTLVDTGALRNFLWEQLAKDLVVKITASKKEVKVVNSKEKKETIFASLVHVQLDDWKRWANLWLFWWTFLNSFWDKNSLGGTKLFWCHG